jgi:hypothetical protein
MLACYMFPQLCSGDAVIFWVWYLAILVSFLVLAEAMERIE